MTTTRHGNNIHPELPACPYCKIWAWRTGDSYLGSHGQVFYTCQTDGCHGAATALMCGLALASIFQRESLEGSYRVAGSGWLNAALRTLEHGRLNECIHGGEEPPASMQVDCAVPSALETTILYGHHTWLTAQPGEVVDLASLFRERIESARAWNLRGEEIEPLTLDLSRS